MNQNQHWTDGRLGWLLLAGLVIAAVVFTFGFATGAATAQTATPNETNISEVAPYYNDSTATPNMDSWTKGARRPSLENFTSYVARIPGFVLGDGGAAQGGGQATQLVFALLLMAGLVGVATGSSVGSVGGAVLGVVGIAGFATAGLLPWWLYVVLLFIVGAVASAVAIRIWR